MLDLLLKGFLIGFAIAAPVGPIGILCINRSLHEGYKAGFVTGLGAATADGLYGFVAAFGLTFIANFLVAHKSWIQLGGGIFLCYLGIKTLLKKSVRQFNTTAKQNFVKAYFTTFILTLTNPMTILSFIAIFAGLGLASNSDNYLAASFLVLGVIIGSLLWWLLLCGTVAIFRKKIQDSVLHWINYLSGLIILGFGLVALFTQNLSIWH